jgi:hypothetical protein
MPKNTIVAALAYFSKHMTFIPSLLRSEKTYIHSNIEVRNTNHQTGAGRQNYV